NAHSLWNDESRRRARQYSSPISNSSRVVSIWSVAFRTTSFARGRLRSRTSRLVTLRSTRSGLRFFPPHSLTESLHAHHVAMAAALQRLLEEACASSSRRGWHLAFAPISRCPWCRPSSPSRSKKGSARSHPRQSFTFRSFGLFGLYKEGFGT